MFLVIKPQAEDACRETGN